MPVMKVDVAVIETTIAVAVDPMRVAVAVLEIIETDEVVSVLPMVIVQSLVLSVATKSMPVISDCAAVPATEIPFMVDDRIVLAVVADTYVARCVAVTKTAVAV